MYELKFIKGYKPSIPQRETQKAIKLVKDNFERIFSGILSLERISAPMFVKSGSGINDDLNGVERPVSFDVPEANIQVEVVHSLAKWKRLALYSYGFNAGEGLYTDMNAIRRDDKIDNLHSVYVDQWDWERVILKKDRTLDYLKSTVQKIVNAIVATKELVNIIYPQLQYSLSGDVHFITSQQLFDLYPNLSAKEREHEITKKYKTVFLIGIGDCLSDGSKHDGRAPDYDDWQLNGDLLFWHDALNEQIEISSMGIRVDQTSLKSQLQKANALDRLKFNYHKGVADGTLPLTIGGGIGQSRLCMLLLEKLHIGEVQASVWPEDMLEQCKKLGLPIL